MSSEPTKNPTGGVASRRIMGDSPLNQTTMEYVVSSENMQRAWKQVKANKGAPGVDDLSISDYPAYAWATWAGNKTSLLEGTLADLVKDKGLLRLIGQYLRAGVVAGGRLNRTSKGVPQGGPLSPLLSNILLDDLDYELKKRGHPFARYADDLVILVKSKRAGERVMASISQFLEHKLKVSVNRDKSKVVKAEESRFLGFTFTGKKLTVSEKSLTKFKTRLRRLTGRSWGVSMDYRYGEIRTYLQGWINYFGIGMKYNDAVGMDQWIRRRIRMCYWKQWRWPRKRIGELIKLGAPRYHAILTGLSRKGYWHLAKTLSSNCGLSNEHLQRQGLLSLRTLWIRIHHPATAR